MEEPILEAREKRRQKFKNYYPKSHLLSLKNLIEETRQTSIQLKKENTRTKPDIKENHIERNVSLFINEEGYAEKDIDSGTLALCIMQAGKNQEAQLTNSHIHIILYIIYGQWLSKYNEKITPETPKAWKFGPVFLKAYNKVRKPYNREEAISAYEKIKEQEPRLFAVITNSVYRFKLKPAWALSTTHMQKGSPWKQTYTLGKHNKENDIPDKLTKDWFRYLTSEL